jgi:hypothetical protein
VPKPRNHQKSDSTLENKGQNEYQTVLTKAVKLCQQCRCGTLFERLAQFWLAQ